MKKPAVGTIEAFFSGKKLPRKLKKTVLAYQRKYKDGYVPNIAFDMMQKELATLQVGE